MSEGSERIVFPATITDRGVIHPDAVNATAGRLAKWKGRHVNVAVTRYVKPKTNPQLGLYFRRGGILDAWADWIGDDREAAHKDLKDAFLVPILSVVMRVNKITGEERPETPSLADQNAEVMSAYIERLLREGAQRGIVFDLSEGE